MIRKHPRGFTLVELMISVGIVGMLSSVAIPNYQRATLRARAAERETILESLSRAVNDVVMQQQRIPGNTCTVGSPCSFTGGANPPPPLSTTKRKFNWTLPGWKDLPMVVAGDSYYSYSFAAIDANGDGKDVTLTVWAEGDLDGDGAPTHKALIFAGVGYAFNLVDEQPPRGTDEGTF
jgi:type IV pilus assembly protein PilA